MTIRVVCQNCQAKMEIKKELAGSTRKCPKCQTEFVVPDPDITLVDDDDEEREDESTEETVVPSEQLTATDRSRKRPHVQPGKSPAPPVRDEDEDDDDDSEDFMPSFLTNGGDKPSSKTPLPPTASKDDDDEPMLSIPKIPPAAKPKFKPFDPDEFAEEETPRPRKREMPASLDDSRPKRTSRRHDEDDEELDEPPSRSSKPAQGGGRGFKLPSPESTGLSDPAAPTSGGTKDRAQAARELRQALKDSALRAPQEAETTRSIAVDLTELAGEIGLKGLAVIIGVLVLLPGVYFASNIMMGDRLKLPKLGYVTGTITYDGAPAVGAQVFFEPRDSEGKKLPETRTSFGVADEKGAYKLMYMEGVEGVAVGKNRVWVQLPPPMITPGEFSQANVTLKDVASGSQKIDFPMTAPAKRK